MRKLITLIVISLFFLSFTFSACYEDQSPQNNDPIFQGARIIVSVDDLPVCDSNADGQLFYITSIDEFQYCDGAEYKAIDLTGPSGENGDDGEDGSDGASIVWKGMLNQAPQSPELNWAYTNNLDGNMYIWDSIAWKIMILNPDYKLKMARIPGGAFNMGQEGLYLADPVVSVNISEFFMSKFEVTYKQFYSVFSWAKENGYYFQNFEQNGYGSMGSDDGSNAVHTPEEPVTNISWGHAIVWCNALSELEGKTPCYYSGQPFGAIDRDMVIRVLDDEGYIDQSDICVDWEANGYRLPTEAEWEYASRSGSGDSYFWGDGNTLSDINLFAWYAENSSDRTHETGLTYPNNFGLYDTAGNVWEWCFDDFDLIHSYIENGNLDNDDPVIVIGQGTARVVKGGSWSSGNDSLLSGNRDSADHFSPENFKKQIGFRPGRRE